MVLCRVGGDMCRNHQVRCHVKITALRDSRGDCKFGEVVVSQDGDINPTVEEDSAWFKFWCEDGGVQIFLKSTEQKLDRNMERTYWKFCYSYVLGYRIMVEYFVSIWCNKETGLSVGFSGPFMYKGSLEINIGLQNKREVSGEPPKELTENAESEIEGKKYTLFKKDENGCTPPSAKAKKAINKAAQATGVINNIGGHTHGNFNGAILKNVQFYGPQYLPRTLESNNSVLRE